MPREYSSSQALDHEVLYVLMQHVGKDNGILRQKLVEQIYGVVVDDRELDQSPYDRGVRASIERLRHLGYMICNRGNGDGYYMAASLAEYQAFRSAYGAHAFPIMEAIREMDRAASLKWNTDPQQPRMM